MVRYSFLVRLFHPLLHAGLIPALSLITLSARANTVGGIVRPICLAAFRLTMNSNFFGCSTEIGWLGSFQNLVHIRGSAPVQVANVHTVGHKPTGFHVFLKAVHHREPALCCNHHHKDCLSPPLARGSECALNILGT
jgi:hypothetical protein